MIVISKLPDGVQLAASPPGRDGWLPFRLFRL